MRGAVLLSVCVMSVLLSAAETWTFKENDMNRIRSLETKCLRKILSIKWQQKIKNKDIMKRTGTDINIMQRMIERKTNFFGHICRMQDERLIKQVVFGITDGKNKRGRPKRRWTDDLADWCNKVGHLHSVQIGDGQEEMDPSREMSWTPTGIEPMEQEREREREREMISYGIMSKFIRRHNNTIQSYTIQNKLKYNIKGTILSFHKSI